MESLGVLTIFDPKCFLYQVRQRAGIYFRAIFSVKHNIFEPTAAPRMNLNI